MGATDKADDNALRSLSYIINKAIIRYSPTNSIEIPNNVLIIKKQDHVTSSYFISE